MSEFSSEYPHAGILAEYREYPRLHLFIDDRLEGVNLQQVRMRAVLFHRHFFPDAPASTAGALNDKHIILIQMRADAAARY